MPFQRMALRFIAMAAAGQHTWQIEGAKTRRRGPVAATATSGEFGFTTLLLTLAVMMLSAAFLFGCACMWMCGSGSRGNAPFPFVDPFGRTVYRQIPVEFDEESLKAIAAMTGGSYFRATDTRTLQQIFAEIDQLEKSEVEVQKVAQYRDLFPWFVLVGTVLLAAETLLGQTLWRRLP